MKTSPPTFRHAVALALAGACLSSLSLSCALTSKSEPVVARYFSPERAGRGAEPASARPSSAVELKLGRIDHASYLDERLVYRDSAYEVGYYEQRRWTEPPDAYLKRALNRVLFEERGARRVIGGAAPTLEVELSAFEEVRAPSHVARIQVTARLQDQRVVKWMDTFTVDQPIADKGGDEAAPAVVAALGQALHTVVAQIADRALATAAASPTPADAASAAAQK